MGIYTIFFFFSVGWGGGGGGFENPRRGRQARNLTANGPKILDLKLSSEHDLLQGILKQLNARSVYWSTVFASFQQCLNYGSDKITEAGTKYTFHF